MRYLRFISIAIASVLLVILAYSCRTIESSSSPAASAQPAAISQLSQEEQDIHFMAALGLMQGHLLVGKELLDQGTPDQAEPHLGHPINELYSEVEAQLAQHNAADFKEPFIELYDTARYAPGDTKVATSYDSSIQQIKQAINTLSQEKRQSPDFVLAVIGEILDVADIEYRAGIANGKIVEIIEYQDSRGFVMMAQTLYETIATQVEQTAPEAHAAISTSLAELQTAWPSVNGPESIVMTPDQVSEKVAKIRSTGAAL